MSGTVELAPKEELAAPEGYHWIQDNWTLDQTGPWIDDALGLGKFLICKSVDCSNSYQILYRSYGITREWRLGLYRY
jgi:hypothetical protein